MNNRTEILGRAADRYLQVEKENTELRARVAELEQDKARLDWLESEMEREGDGVWRDSLFRRNQPITRAAIDAVKEGAK